MEPQQVVTAGAYVWVDGRIPFVVGPTREGTALAVVRLGGHREGNETPWACAVREALEEASLQIEPRRPPTTYRIEGDEPRFVRADWPSEPSPLFVSAKDGRLTAMYLAQATGQPKPAAETRGLLLLRPADVSAICQERLTLRAYLDRGGHAVLRAPMDEALPLVPFPQLRWLARFQSGPFGANLWTERE